ncbi:hypothetical protein QW060_19660, partial [Myroides ceti]
IHLQYLDKETFEYKVFYRTQEKLAGRLLPDCIQIHQVRFLMFPDRMLQKYILNAMVMKSRILIIQQPLLLQSDAILLRILR